MDFARPVSFRNADIGRCAQQKAPEEAEGGAPAETVILPEPVPTPAFPSPTPVPAHVSVAHRLRIPWVTYIYTPVRFSFFCL